MMQALIGGGKISRKRSKKNNYSYFIISIDISDDFWRKQLASKEKKKPEEDLKRWFWEHQNFLKNHKDEVDISITDNNFPRRLEISRQAAGKFLES